jgi:hypothetical protein
MAGFRLRPFHRAAKPVCSLQAVNADPTKRHHKPRGESGPADRQEPKRGDEIAQS